MNLVTFLLLWDYLDAQEQWVPQEQMADLDIQEAKEDEVSQVHLVLMESQVSQACQVSPVL